MLKELGCEDDEPITKMAREKLEALHEAAEANVGWARLFEMLMDAVVHNLVCFVRWEHRFGIRGSLGTGFQFPPLVVVKETDIPDEGQCERVLAQYRIALWAPTQQRTPG